MSRNQQLFEEAQNYYVGGVDAANRYHGIMKSTLFVDHADGSHLYDVDGKAYLDFHTSAGAALFGYNHPRLMEAARKALERGGVMNFETKDHVELAKLMSKMFPCAERIRLGNTGTEVTQAAVRLARGYTGRDICIRMEGHFHGMNELVWYNHNNEGTQDAMGEVETIPDTAGVPECFRSVVKNVEFNNIEQLERVCERYQGQIACIILEPVSFNCGCYPGRKEYLEKVRTLCDREGIVLIFDEVICGLRMRPGSAQAYYGVTPDLATFAKAIGGSFPIAALCGKQKVMESLAPLGKVGMSGTYTGALMPVMASKECFRMAMEPDFYDEIDHKAELLYGGINDLFHKHGIPGHCRGLGARFGLYFGVEDPETDFNWRSAKKAYNLQQARAFVREALDAGMYFVDPGKGPQPPHCGFGIQHSDADLNSALERIDTIFAKIK
ncbi:glutamate-1-semialdehyde 2,1-aminomutase [Oscillibacter sp. PC13]|uniref:aspartate aminotransferase family protein n=1 Tax=Oscillibacter sp. PC13 TaxID=1855299 RepID=UPI0008E7F631|nr:aspartate aminotransferase family protein [Oscillibacter sp. PC13]SFP61959.1 glutamate-1-semialdehyde 2,1-aminomutase [Oscillibacter sp. PC13]